MAEFWANSLEYVSDILWFINIYDVKDNLTADSFNNNLLGYSNSHLIFFILFILIHIRPFYRTTSDRYNISNIFLNEHVSCKYCPYIAYIGQLINPINFFIWLGHFYQGYFCLSFTIYFIKVTVAIVIKTITINLIISKIIEFVSF